MPKHHGAHAAPAEAHAPAEDADAPAAAPDASEDPSKHGDTKTETSSSSISDSQTPAKEGTIADYLNKAEVALDKVNDGNFAGGKFDAQIKRVEQAIDKVQESGLI